MTETTATTSARQAAAHRIGACGSSLHRFFIRALNRSLAQEGLTHLQFLALYQIHTGGAPLSQSDLAELLAIEGQTVVRMLDSMEAEGWVRRVPDSLDRRIKRVAIAADPQRLQRVLDKFRALQMAALEEFTGEELETFNRLQLKMSQGITRFAEAADERAEPATPQD